MVEDNRRIGRKLVAESFEVLEDVGASRQWVVEVNEEEVGWRTEGEHLRKRRSLGSRATPTMGMRRR